MRTVLPSIWLTLLLVVLPIRAETLEGTVVGVFDGDGARGRGFLNGDRFQGSAKKEVSGPDLILFASSLTAATLRPLTTET